MKPFLLLQSRPEDETSNNEYEGFLRATLLPPELLKRVRGESAPLPSINLDDYSGIIIGGGPFNFSDPAHKKSAAQKRLEKDLHRLLDQIVKKDFPLLGACYGIGIVGSHQGATINNVYAEKLGPVTVTLTEEGRNDPLLMGIPSSFQVLTGHKEACETLPAHAKLLVTSPACPVQMFKFKQNIYVTQFHPELDMDGVEVRVRHYKYAGYFPPDEAEEILAIAAQADLTYPPIITQNFVRRFASFLR